MRKFAAVMCVALGLATLPNVAEAAPIGVNGCTTTLIYECDIFVDDVTGLSTLDATGLNPNPDWLVGYTFLLNVAADLSDGIQETDVAHALVIHRNLVQLFTPTVTNPSQFSQAIANALALLAIDGVPLSDGQIVGEPVPGGVTQLNGVGLFLTADLVSMAIAWGQDINNVGGFDLLNVHTATASSGPGPNPIPEPGMLSLMLLGGGGAIASALRRRRTSHGA
jgi:hypothetical protein